MKSQPCGPERVCMSDRLKPATLASWYRVVPVPGQQRKRRNKTETGDGNGGETSLTPDCFLTPCVWTSWPETFGTPPPPPPRGNIVCSVRVYRLNWMLVWRGKLTGKMPIFFREHMGQGPAVSNSTAVHQQYSQKVLENGCAKSFRWSVG